VKAIEYGEPPVLIEQNRDCMYCGQVHDIEACPKCGFDIVLGFGLMFGGYGEYKFCEGDDCDWYWKRQDLEGMTE